MNFGILFSGQGAQKSGMGLDFMTDPLFKVTIEAASEASKQDILADFKNENKELTKTINVQPALVAFEVAIYRMLKRDCPLDPKGMLGLSLGEYSAIYASGALSLSDCISLVSDRAKYMQLDSDKLENGMTALIKPKLNEIKELLAALQTQGNQVYIANYNSPSQIVIAGEKNAVLLATAEIKTRKLALKTISLKVNGAFHTPLFNAASQKMKTRLQSLTFKDNTIPVISNTTSLPFKNNWQEVLAKQLAVPTHFGNCLAYLIAHYAVDATIEIGPGHTLSSFAKQIDRKLVRYQIGTYEDYLKFVEVQNGIAR